MRKVIIIDKPNQQVSKNRKFLGYAVLVLSLFNLVQMIPAVFISLNLNIVLSIGLSFVGIAAFWATINGKANADKLTMLWLVPQFIILINYPYFTIDLSQGYSFPLGINYWHKSNDIITRQFNLSFNAIALVLYLGLRYTRNR